MGVNPVSNRPTITREQADRIATRASTVFTPRTPISNRDLVAGRRVQIQQLVDAVYVLMRGIADGLIRSESLTTLLGPDGEPMESAG